MIEWTDASTATYTAESTTINDYLVVVCLDDEGPLHPAFYWTVGIRPYEVDGWSSSVEQARADAVEVAQALPLDS